MVYKYCRYTLFLLITFGLTAVAEEPDAYMQVALGRAEKIVKGMGLADDFPEHAAVVQAIAGQYHALNALHEARDAAKASLRSILGEQHEDLMESAMQTIEAGVAGKVKALHVSYCAQLASLLTAEQVDAVKNGMTYNVAPNTYAVYMDMLPDLSPSQRAQIKAWLLEAREYAMDGGSSEEKHRWFGKYKGRINNYLSQLGYDLKQAEHDMLERKKQK